MKGEKKAFDGKAERHLLPPGPTATPNHGPLALHEAKVCPTASGCSFQLAVSEEHGLDQHDLAMCPGILSLPLAPPLGTILLFAMHTWGKFKILVIAEWSVSALTLCRLCRSRRSFSSPQAMCQARSPKGDHLHQFLHQFLDTSLHQALEL